MSARASLRPVLGGEDDERAARRRDHVRPALRAWALLEQHELAAVEVGARLGEDGHHLEGEGDLAVEVLVQRVPVAGAVAEDQRRRALLPGGAAPLEQRLVLTGIR